MATSSGYEVEQPVVPPQQQPQLLSHHQTFYPKLQYSNQVIKPISMRTSVAAAGGVFHKGLHSTTIENTSFGFRDQSQTIKSAAVPAHPLSSFSGSHSHSKKGLLHKQSLRLMSANPSRPSTSGGGPQILRISSNLTFGDFKQQNQHIIHQTQSGNSSSRQVHHHRRLKSGVPTMSSAAKESLQESLRQQATEFQTHQLRPSGGGSETGSQANLNLRREKSIERTSTERQKSSLDRDYFPTRGQSATKNTKNLLQLRSKKHTKNSASNLYQINPEGQVVILKSKIVHDQMSPMRSGGKMMVSSGTYEQLSTDETELRFKVSHIEQTIQERAMIRYREMVQSGRNEEDLQKIAKQINDITYKYRVQNGGGLSQPSYAFRYPQDVRVNRVSGLDITPITSEKDKKIDFKNFQRHISQPNPDRVRQDYPIIGSGTSKPTSKIHVSILHDPGKMQTFMDPPNRYTSKTRGVQGQGIWTTLPSQQQSPRDVQLDEENQQKIKIKNDRVQTARSKEALLLQRMEEARKKYLKKDVSSEELQNAKTKNEIGDEINPVTDVHHARMTMFSKYSEHIRKHALSVEEKLIIQSEVAKDDRFLRSTIQTNRLRMLSSEKGGKVPIDMQKVGFDHSTQVEFDQQYFDPLRLKILVMPYSEANPVGKNADYFFIKGFKYSVSEDYAHAMAAYLKGLDIRSDHLLCRFNLGVMLFKLGLYQEASTQYSILTQQGYSDRTVVMYNKALSELQAAQFEKAIESSQACISILIKKKKANQSKLQTQANTMVGQVHEKGRITTNTNEITETQSVLSDNEIEMLADMHVVLGLANLRLLNLKKAGRCFDEAKAYTVPRKSEMLILVQKCMYKMVHERIMEDFRRKAKTQNKIGIIDEKRQGKNQSTLSRNQRAQSVPKIYLTDLDNPIFGKVKVKDGVNIIEEIARRIDPEKIIPSKNKSKRQMSARLPTTQLILDVMLEEGFQGGQVSLFPKQPPIDKQQTNISQGNKKPTPESFPPSLQKVTPAGAPLQTPALSLPTVDDLTFPELMDVAKTLIAARSDPKHCYQYIDDEKTVRLDKILGLPNTFETKRSALTEKERTEKARREGIEFYLMQNIIGNAVRTRMGQGEMEETLNISELYPVKDRLTGGINDQKKADQEAFQEFMYQIKKFNQKLDLSLNYFLNDHGGPGHPNGGHSKNNGQTTQKKLDSEIEQGIKVIRDMIAAQKNKQPEIILPRLKVQELTLLEEEMSKQNKLDRNLEVLEKMLLKLRAFKSLNPQLLKLVLLRSSFRKVQKNEVLYNQGEEGQCYYYMLRGSVTMLSKRDDCGNFELFLKSYYDGEVFGEQPQLFAKQDNLVASDEQLHKLSLRDSTCIVNEESMILEVSNSVKHEFYRNDSSNEYERCIHWLKKNPIFKFTEGFYLLQMIFNIEKRTYNLGESLVKSGEVPDGMFIITSGQCKAVMEGIGVNKVGSGEYSRFQSKPKNFACGTVPESLLQKNNSGLIQKPKTEEQSPKKEATPHNHHINLNGVIKKFNPDISSMNFLKGDEKRTFPNTRLYLDDENKHLPDHIAFQNTIVYAELVPGDSFGSRTLLPDDEIMKRMKPSDDDLAKAQQAQQQNDQFSKTKTLGGTLNLGHQSSKNPVFVPPTSSTSLFKKAIQNLKTSALSIVADSNQVEVLILRWNILTFMPEIEKDKIYTDIVKLNKGGKYGGADPDKPSSITEVMNIKNGKKQWEGYRVKLVDGIRKSQYMERHKGVYKR